MLQWRKTGEKNAMVDMFFEKMCNYCRNVNNINNCNNNIINEVDKDVVIYKCNDYVKNINLK